MKASGIFSRFSVELASSKSLVGQSIGCFVPIAFISMNLCHCYRVQAWLVVQFRLPLLQVCDLVFWACFASCSSICGTAFCYVTPVFLDLLHHCMFCFFQVTIQLSASYAFATQAACFDSKPGSAWDLSCCEFCMLLPSSLVNVDIVDNCSARRNGVPVRSLTRLHKHAYLHAAQSSRIFQNSHFLKC